MKINLVLVLVLVFGVLVFPVFAHKPQPPITTMGGNIFMLKTVLTDAQIKSLPFTGVEVVPSQGVGKIILPLNMVVIIDAQNGTYTNIDPSAALYLAWTDISGSDLWSTPETHLGIAWALSDGFGHPFQAWSLPTTPNGYYVYTADLDNRNLVIAAKNNGLGDFEGGDAANTLTVTVYYMIVDL